MKTDLTHLSLEDQIAAVADRLRALVACGLTDAPDLQRYFKHRAFKQPAHRAWHFANLRTAAVLLLNGRQAEFAKVFAALQAAGVIFEPGDRVMHDGLQWLVSETLPDAKLLLKRLSDTRVALARLCQPAPAAYNREPYSCATNG